MSKKALKMELPDAICAMLKDGGMPPSEWSAYIMTVIRHLQTVPRPPSLNEISLDNITVWAAMQIMAGRASVVFDDKNECMIEMSRVFSAMRDDVIGSMDEFNEVALEDIQPEDNVVKLYD